ncbi:type I methionyl aminopeptidase [Phytopseudomonas seleniipraecipitans]|uniref:Methionine aminopeptidase n=1 Tax=Phytopseudomonas seleniipraecipitans TaxID=640205 RepID=A0A1G7UU50_9GAMM|nr:type I methionyl aminopeptidase [Pseudomonas seleniipraecipitans]SDG50639.1 methionine aminopeptidase, type I [Pseudomonas seleniipraecipitans]
MIKTAHEIELMAESGRLLASVFSYLDTLELLGMSTLQVNDLVDNFIVRDLNARPSSKGQYGYAYALNSSRNQVVCHGVPSAVDILQSGDLVNFDITLEKNGYIADSSKTYLIGNVSAEVEKLARVTYEALWKGIDVVRPGARLGEIGYAIEQHARAHGYSVVREYCGHGIGKQMHEPPEVLHWGKAKSGLTLREGMVFTIEPMINQGLPGVRTLRDGWTVVTRDGQLSAQFEHTVAVTAEGVRVLTLRPEEQQRVEANQA